MAKVRRYVSMPLAISIVNTAGAFSCSVVSPSAGASLTQGTPVTVALTTSAPASSVDFYANAVFVGSATGSGTSWSYSWTPSVVGAANLTAVAVSSNSVVATSPTVAVTVASSATDYGTLAVANGLTVVNYFRGDVGLSGSQGTGFAAWSNLAGASSGMTPHGSATNGIGAAAAGLNGRASLKQNGATQKGAFTAPTLVAAGTTNFHKYLIAKQASGGSSAARGILQDAGATDLYLSTGALINGVGLSVTDSLQNDVFQRMRFSWTGGAGCEMKVGNNAAVTGTGTNVTPGTTRTFGDLVTNWEWLLLLEVTGTKANFLTFAGLADTAARTVDWTTAVQI